MTDSVVLSDQETSLVPARRKMDVVIALRPYLTTCLLVVILVTVWAGLRGV